MNTSNTNFTIEDRSTKILFRQLFLLQIQLEYFQNQESDYHNEVEEVIRTIDRLMDALLNE